MAAQPLCSRLALTTIRHGIPADVAFDAPLISQLRGMGPACRARLCLRKELLTTRGAFDALLAQSIQSDFPGIAPSSVALGSAMRTPALTLGIRAILPRRLLRVWAETRNSGRESFGFFFGNFTLLFTIR